MANLKWRYYEGTTSANDILKDLSKVLCTGVKDKIGKVIQERNWDIIYPDVDPNPPENDYLAPTDKRNLTEEEFQYKIKNQLRQITDKVILKTKTTPIEINTAVLDDLALESDLNVQSIEMYIELYKPSYLADPEQYSPETERHGLLPILKVYDEANLNVDDNAATKTSQMLIRNNHYIYMRAFDKINITKVKGRIIEAGPSEETTDPFTGVLVETDCHVSEWAKLSWYQDFKELDNDVNDADIGEDNIGDGITFAPIVTPGINGDTRIRFWINSNNDRVSFVLMGNPSLDLSDNKHLISFGYLGRIVSFDGSINDTAGNFAIVGSSSTYPYNTIQKVLSTETIAKSDPRSSVFVDNGDGLKNKFFVPLQYTPTPGTEEVLIDGNLQSKMSYSIKYNLLEFLIPPAAGKAITFRAEFKIPTVDLRQGVVKDSFGNPIKIYAPDKYGKNTATCITDVGMYHTRSKAYWQKHLLMFNTTEEYMSKSMYGKSAYTNEYYADKIKLTHGNDGPRGMFDACLIIDQSSLVPLDDLVQNRDFKRDANKDEETYIYFPITAPYSPLTSGPNDISGVALLKEIKRPAPKDDAEAVLRVADDLYIGNIKAITSNFTVPLTGDYSSTITWLPSDGVALSINDDTGAVTVTRPAVGATAKAVTLTATVSIGTNKKEVVFNCVILPLGMSAAQAVAADKTWLVTQLGGNTDLGDISTDLLLYVEGPNETIIEWTSSDPSVKIV